MLEIEYKGGNTLVLSTKKTSVVLDPSRVGTGLKPLVLKDSIRLTTEERFAAAGGEGLALEGPGEYEVGDFSIRGVAARRHIDAPEDGKHSTIYRIEAGDIRIAVFGNVAADIHEDQFEELGVVDVVVVPVGGGGYTLDATAAAAIVRHVTPTAAIPVHYADAELSYEVPQDALDVFTKELGAPVEEVGAKYKLKGPSALPETLTSIVITRS